MQTPESVHQAPDLREYIGILRRRQMTIIAITVLVIGSALAFSYLQTPQYTAKARVLVEPIPTSSTASTAQPVPPVVNLETEKEIVSSFPVAAIVKEELGSKESTDELLDHLSVEGVTETEVLVISYTATDPRFASDAANAFANGYLDFRRSQARKSLSAAAGSVRQSLRQLNEQITNLTEQIQEARDGGDEVLATTLETERTSLLARLGIQEQRLQDLQPDRLISLGGGKVIEPALTPSEPSSPSYSKNGLLAAFLGLALGIGLAFLRERLDDRFRGRADVERALEVPVLATIPRYTVPRQGRAHNLVVTSEPQGSASEAYRGLRTNLQFVAQQEGVKSVLITSASAVEGKTVTTANLGVGLAQAGRRVTIVSADLRRPTIERYFYMVNRNGLTSWLAAAEDSDLNRFVQDTNVDGLRLLPSGTPPPNPAELLTSPRLTELIERLEADNDFVLFDAPPTLAVADASILATQVGGTVLLIDASKTHRSAAVRAREELERVGGRVFGAVLNAFDRSTAPYYYEPYYYESYQPSKQDDGNGGSEATPSARPRSKFTLRR